MKHTIGIVPLAAAWMLCLAMPAHAVRTVVWDKTVIPLQLVVGVEQMLHFEESVTPGLTAMLNDPEFFRTMSSNGTVYMTALRAFDAERVKFKLENGDYILMDLSATTRKVPPKAVEPIKIVSERVAEGKGGSADRRDMDATQKKPRQVSMFDVLRYGAQVMVSPKRVIKPVPGITTASLKIKGDLARLYQAKAGEAVSIRALRSWTAGGVYVTALKVRNTGTQPLTFDLSRLQHTHKTIVNGVNNQFIATAMLGDARVLGSHGAGPGRKKHPNSTFVLVATDHPFASVLDL